MDTIIYLTLNKNNVASDIIAQEKAGTYRLLRVKVDFGQKPEEWVRAGKHEKEQPDRQRQVQENQEQSLREQVRKEQSESQDESESDMDRFEKAPGGWRLFFENRKMAKQSRKQERQSRKQEQQSRQSRKQERQSRKQERQRQKQEQQQEQLKREWIREKTDSLREQLAGNSIGKDICFTVYDISLEKWLREEGCTEWWKEYWPYPEFDGYHEFPYAEELLAYGHSPHFLILGYDRLVPELILSHIRKMKSLRLILDYLPKDLEGFLEDLYEEYGLAATFQLLPETQEHPYRSARILCSRPSVVLDFSGEGRMLTSGVVKDSVWLDMDSMEEKRRRIEERDTGILYISLKKQWAQGLDTPIKNRYNTEVN